MRKWIAIAILSASWCPQVKGQACQPLANASISSPNYLILMPDEFATQGGATATLTTQSTVAGNVPSHNLIVTPGPYGYIGFVYSSNNGVSGQAYYTTDNGAVQTQMWTGLNGSDYHYWLPGSGDVGHTYHVFYVVTDSNGNTTEDRVNVSVVAGSGPSIVFQDDFPTNYLLQLTIPFSGNTSMITTENCPGARNAIHSAPESGTFSNPTSGQTQSFTSTGNTFCSNCAFSENSPPSTISFLPGDAPPRTTTTDKLECSLAGPFLALIQRTGDSTQNQRIDKKMWTKVKAVQQAGDGGWYTQDWCIQAEPPIWSPNEIYSNLLPLYTYFWTAQTCSSSPPGTDPGPGWHCPGIAGGPGPGAPEKFFPSHTGVKGSCNTNVNTPAPY